MIRRAWCLAAALALVGAPVAARADDSEQGLERGIQLVREGRYAEAIIVLDAAASRLAVQPARQAQAAQAYLHLGSAYLGEGQEALAKASFREAAARDEALVLSAFDVSPKVRELFQQARNELAQERLAQSGEKKSGSKMPWILVSVLGAGGAATAVASRSWGDEGEGFDPTARLEIRRTDSERVPLVGLEVTWEADAFGFDNASWLWDFGDGNTSNENFTARHTYAAAGSYQVVLTVSRGSDSLRSELGVGVRSLAGTWDGQSGDGDSFVVQMTQTGTILSGDVDGVPIDGTVNNDHWVMLGTTCGTRFEGFVSNDATQIDGSGDLPCRQYSSPQLLTFR